MNDIETLLQHIYKELDDRVLRESRLPPEYEYPSVPLCVIDAVYSIGANYSSTSKTVEKWCRRHNWPISRRDQSGPERTIDDFVNIMKPYSDDFDRMADQLFDNSQRTSSKSGIRKAEAAYEFARVLKLFEIDTLHDAITKTKNHMSRAEIKRHIQVITGQSSGLSYSYFLLLIGHEDVVKPDRMIRRFVANALGVRTISPERAEQLIIRACGYLTPAFPGLTPRELDHLIWKSERAKDESTRMSRHKSPRRAAPSCVVSRPNRSA